MPGRPERVCRHAGCDAIVTTERCAAHRQTAPSERRGSAASRGYDASWRHFIRWFPSRLVAAGIAPVCGATLPGGPVTTDSRCRAAGLLTFTNVDGTALHGDHEPPLLPHERHDPVAVANELRVQLLCAACHAAKGT